MSTSYVVQLMSAAVCVAAMAGCGHQPAKVGEPLSGPAAEELLALQPEIPILVARAGDGVVAIPFARDPLDAEDPIDRVAVDEVVGCDPKEGAVACCAREEGVFRLNTERGWLPMGDSCRADLGGQAEDVPKQPAIDEGDYEPASDLAP